MKTQAIRLIICASLAILSTLMQPLVFAIVPTPAADQTQPIAIVGAVIHLGNG